MKAVEYSKALYKITRADVIAKLRATPKAYQAKIEDVVKQLKERGFAVFEDYYTEEQCADLRTDIDQQLVTQKEFVQVDKEGADYRLFGGDRVSPLIHDFYHDDFLTQVRNCYYKHDGIVGCTLAARIQTTENNRGSGGGWHRDMIYGRQLKAILYLSDVSEDNGPFQFMENTHRTSSILETIQKCGIKAFQNRLSHEDIDKIKAIGGYDVTTMLGKAGTLLIIDTTSIHRGKPLQAGKRYALTNYYFEHKIPEHINKLIVSE